jgi:Putative restriction endonuclease
MREGPRDRRRERTERLFAGTLVDEPVARDDVVPREMPHVAERASALEIERVHGYDLLGELERFAEARHHRLERTDRKPEHTVIRPETERALLSEEEDWREGAVRARRLVDLEHDASLGRTERTCLSAFELQTTIRPTDRRGCPVPGTSWPGPSHARRKLARVVALSTAHELLVASVTAPPLPQPMPRRRDALTSSAYAEDMRAPKKKTSPALVYPEADDMGEHELQRFIAELLRPLLARFLAERGVVAHAGADQFIYWAEGTPTKRIAPDVYVLPGVPQEIAIPSWKTWETGVAPSFVLEIAGDDYSKDYEDNPVLYDELGVDELVIFDPHARPGSRSRRVRWQVYRRLRGRGLVRVEVSQSDRIRSKLLKAWLRSVGSGDEIRLRLALGTGGDELYPTEAEAERAAKEQERSAKEHERARRVAAEAEVERLRGLLAKKSGRQARSRPTRVR